MAHDKNRHARIRSLDPGEEQLFVVEEGVEGEDVDLALAIVVDSMSLLYQFLHDRQTKSQRL